MSSFENLQQLIDLLDDEPGITELSVHCSNGEQITVRRSAALAESTGKLVPAATVSGQNHGYAAGQGEVVSIEEDELHSVGQGALETVVVTANRVGIFHSAKEPLKSGGQVVDGQIVGYIESMKLMNEIRSEVGGEVAERLISDGTPVEYGQPLFRVFRAL